MMGLFGAAMNLVHGKSNTNTPYTNFHQLSAKDIDLNEVRFADLAGQVRKTPDTWPPENAPACAQPPTCLTSAQAVLVVNVASK